MRKTKKAHMEKAKKQSIFDMADINKLVISDSVEEKEDVEVNLTCPICLCEVDLDDYVYNLACKHLFHMECLEMWYARRKTCPMCIQNIEFVVTTESHYTFDREAYEARKQTSSAVVAVNPSEIEMKTMCCVC